MQMGKKIQIVRYLADFGMNYLVIKVKELAV